MKKCLSLLLFFSLPVVLQSQVPNGPAGVGNTSGSSTLEYWYRPETGVTITSGSVSTWADQSGNANDLSSPNGFRPVIATSAAMNGASVMRYTGAQYFSSSVSGPNVDDLTLFLACNGTSYQSLFRWQNTSGTYVVYPWELGATPRVFISSSDGGTGSGVASGLVTSANNVGGARYRRNTTNGMQTYLNGGVNAQRNSVNSALPSQAFFSGRYNPGPGEYPTCDVGDMIVYYDALNDVQMILVQNYLAAKYNVALGSNDVYTMDNSGNGNFDFDVAGIGRISGSDLHNDAQGTGIVRILNPNGLGNGEYYMWGHDNGAMSSSTTDSPTGQGVQRRLVRVWRGSETGTITDFDLRFDLTGMGAITTSDLRLLIDTDNDGNFADETTAGGGVLSGASSLGSNVYEFSNVTGLNNAIRFTLGTADFAATPLPVELVTFKAVPAEKRVDLSWTTATETNCDFFEAERSINGLDFVPFAKVISKSQDGRSQTYLHYSAADTDPAHGVNYYRLRSVDKDRSGNYSPVISATYLPAGLAIDVFPNPGKREFTIRISGPVQGQLMQLRLLNGSGKEVYTRQQEITFSSEGFCELQMRLDATFTPGIYLCHLQVGAQRQQLKLVLE